MRHAAGGGPAPMRLPTPALTGSTAKGSRCCARASGMRPGHHLAEVALGHAAFPTRHP